MCEILFSRDSQDNGLKCDKIYNKITVTDYCVYDINFTCKSTDTIWKKSGIAKLCRTFADGEDGLQNSERLSIAALRRFRYYKRLAIGATNDGVRIGAKTINDPEVDRGNLNSLLYSVSTGMAKERTAHACPRGLASLWCELREHLFPQTNLIRSLRQDAIKWSNVISKNASKFRPSERFWRCCLPSRKLVSYSRANVRHNATVHSKRLTQPDWVQCLLFIDTGRPASGHVPWYGKVHYAPFVRASMRQSRNQMRTSDDT